MVLVTGGSSCPGKADLSNFSSQPALLCDFVARLKGVPQSSCAPVGVFLDAMASAPKEIVKQFSAWFGCQPVTVRAEIFGWVRLRNFCACELSLQDLLKERFPQGC